MLDYKKLFLIIFATAISLGLWIQHTNKQQQLNLIVTELTKEQVSHDTIQIYSVDRYPPTYEVKALLQMYGLNLAYTPVSSYQELASRFPSLAADKGITIPLIILANGQTIDLETLENTITKLKYVTFNPNESGNYLILYGVNGCPYTAKTRTQLDSMGISYQYVDLNSDAVRYIGELRARFIASGYFSNSVKTPYLEYNGYIRPREYVTEIIESIKH